MLATAVNRFSEFRTDINAQGSAGIWSVMHPSYTVFNRERETFAHIWTPYDSDFLSFHDAVTEDLAHHGTATKFQPQANMPANIFDISSLSWLSFTGFNLNIGITKPHLPPIFTIGQYIEQEESMHMPLAVQVHHAACDGFHAGRFTNALQNMATNWENWINTPG